MAPRSGWPRLGEEDQAPIDGQSFRNGNELRQPSNRYPLGDSGGEKRFGPRAIPSDLIPADLSIRNIQEQQRNPDGTFSNIDNDGPTTEKQLQRIVNLLDILTKPKVVKKSFMSRQVTLSAGATAIVLINAQYLRGYILQNTSGVTAFIGAEGVTASSGFEIAPNKSYEFYLEEGVKMYAFSAGAATLQIIEL